VFMAQYLTGPEEPNRVFRSQVYRAIADRAQAVLKRTPAIGRAQRRTEPDQSSDVP
jgi:hypothetical protein